MVRGNDGRGDAPAVTDASSSTTCAAFWQLEIPGSATSAHSPRSRGTARWVPRLWWNDFTDTGLPPPRAQASTGQCGQFPPEREYRETGLSYTVSLSTMSDQSTVQRPDPRKLPPQT